MEKFWEWFAIGVQWSQILILFACGYFLMDGVRMVKRSNRIINDQQRLLSEMLDHLRFQHGIITAMRAGMIAPWHLEPIDLRSLPVEMRLAIWRSLIDVGIEIRSPPKERSDAHQGQACT